MEAPRVRHGNAKVPVALDEMRAEIAAGVTDPRRQTVAAVTDRWLDALTDEGKAPKTVSSYRQWSAYILPTLGHVPVRDLALAHVESLDRKLRADGLSPATRNHARTALGQIVKRARRERIVPEGFDPLRERTGSEAHRPQPRPLRREGTGEPHRR